MGRVERGRQLVRRGLSEPWKIPAYVIGRLFPDSPIGPSVVLRDGVVTFGYGGFASSPDNRPQFAADLYYESSGLQELLRRHVDSTPVESSLEIGCGYGRLSPWFAELSDEHYAVDPNERALADARQHYPEVSFEAALAQSLPYPDGQFGVVATWTSLMHIPPETFPDAVGELKRVVADDGILLICENVNGETEKGGHTWPRRVEEYADAFSPFELVETTPRPLEPTYLDRTGRDEIPAEMLIFEQS